MKTKKQRTFGSHAFLALIAILALALALTACGGDDTTEDDTTEQAEFRNEQITLSNGKTIIVEATTLEDEYATLKANLAAGFEYIYEKNDLKETNRTNTMFKFGFTTVKLGSNVGSGKFEVTLAELGIINLDLNHVLKAKSDELGSTLIDAFKGAMGEGPAVG